MRVELPQIDIGGVYMERKTEFIRPDDRVKLQDVAHASGHRSRLRGGPTIAGA